MFPNWYFIEPTDLPFKLVLQLLTKSSNSDSDSLSYLSLYIQMYPPAFFVLPLNTLDNFTPENLTASLPVIPITHLFYLF